MAPPTVQTLQRLAAETGYRLETLEKVLRLLDLLDEIAEDPILSDRLVLKGGTALNVFHLDLDRLSVDIDLNYIGALDLAVMESERPEVDAAIDRLLASQGYGVRRRPTGHAGGKWLSRYASALGGNASLELDVNYMARQPLFGAIRMECRLLGRVRTSRVLVLDLHEIVAGKIVALFDRRAARDLFDVRRILSIEGLDWGRIKTAVLAIGACNRRDWRTVSSDAIACDPREFRQSLAICLPRGLFADSGDVDAWIAQSVALCRERLAFLFDLSEDERRFLDGLLDRGEVNADLLGVEPEVRARIGAMPMLAWKARHACLVGSRQASPGMDDRYHSPLRCPPVRALLVGSIDEQVEDCGRYSYEAAPSDGFVQGHDGTCTQRMMRGGSWLSLPMANRPANRVGNPGGYQDINIGFRVAGYL